jgi:hypothetical protein
MPDSIAIDGFAREAFQAPAECPETRGQRAILAHMARIFGIAPGCFEESRIVLVEGALDGAQEIPRSAELVVLLQPSARGLASLGIKGIAGRYFSGVRSLRTPVGVGGATELVTLHGYQVYSFEHGTPGEAVVVDEDGAPVWLLVRRAGVAWLVIGTELGADIVRVRQGDPGQASHRSGAEKCDFDF